MTNLSDYISEQLYKHLCIDYELYENAGLYNGIEDLCRFLTNKIRTHQEKEFTISYKSTDRELSKFDNIFFKSIILKCERSNKNRDDGEYLNNSEFDYDSNESKLRFVNIKLYLSQTHNAQEVYSILLHEITHAWDSYNSFKKGTTTIGQAFRDAKYSKILDLMDNTKNNDGVVLGTILYFLNNVEVNAWVAGFAGYLYDYLETNEIKTPHEALRVIKQSNLYENYVNIGVWVNALYNGKLNRARTTGLCNEYNKLYGTNYTESKIKKLLYSKYEKVKNKIDSSIGKLCTRYVKEVIIR